MKKILPAFLSCQGARLSDKEKRLFSEYNPLGVCLFSKFCANVENAEQLKCLTTEIKEVIGRENVLIAVDQEGGRVRRLTDPEFTPLTSQADINSIELAQEHAYLASYDLKRCGINVNFAPVLDIITPKTSKVLQGRCFASDVAKYGQAMIDEYINCGVCPCVKHLPGHGKAAVDPHLELPLITENLAELERDFAPFTALKKAPMGMVAHIVLQAVDKKNSATVSTKVIQKIIRQHIGFEGLLVSDAIVMRALKGSVYAKAKQAVTAGCEVICLGNAGFDENVELCKSGIELSDESEERLQKIFEIVSKSLEFTEYEYIKNKYCTKLKNIVAYNYDYDATEVLNKLRKQ